MEKSKQVKSLSFEYEHPSNAAVAAVQVFVDAGFITVVYLNERGSILDAETFSMDDNPEFKGIVTERTFDDVWNFDLVLALVEPVDSEERLPIAPLVPSYLESIGVAV